MDISQEFQGQYLKAESLGGRPRRVTISSVAKESIGDPPETKIVISFSNGKRMVGNKTNCFVIAALYGNNTAGWIGHPIELYPDMVNFAGKMVPAIRVRAVPPAVPARAVPVAPVAPVAQLVPDSAPILPPAGAGDAWEAPTPAPAAAASDSWDDDVPQ